jgi:transcriptional regulator with XRE-family HTH domain
MREVSEFGRLVRKYREERSMSQQRLADLTGHTDGYISQLETGSRGKRPDRDLVVSIAQALHVPLNELLVSAGLDPIEQGNHRANFATAVTTDPLLRSDQKRVLIDIYEVFVGRSG